MAKKLSRRPLKRDRKFEIELNPGGHFILWISEVPKGKRSHRFMSVVQKMNRAGDRYSDEIHNPILFRKVVVLPNTPDSEGVAKRCYRKAQKFMYWTLEGALRQCGDRCRLRLRASTSGEWPPPEWQTLEPPARGEEALSEWRSSGPKVGGLLERLLERPTAMSAFRPPTTDQQWAEYLSTSSDPDDQSLSARIRLVSYLESRGRRNRTEAKWLRILKHNNAKELHFLRATTAYRLSHSRPCWPRWHWPDELLDLYTATFNQL